MASYRIRRTRLSGGDSPTSNNKQQRWRRATWFVSSSRPTSPSLASTGGRREPGECSGCGLIWPGAVALTDAVALDASSVAVDAPSEFYRQMTAEKVRVLGAGASQDGRALTIFGMPVDAQGEPEGGDRLPDVGHGLAAHDPAGLQYATSATRC
ncbi:unnamed protein product [Phytophthora lilii]|uniref:Unnamed protein product n=1 Tax=Phytophthora lilii TaxID=2077276 RepID=A0A9W6U082_9STRA|nr:unnamed protein product [Phytophthora lilii]